VSKKTRILIADDHPIVRQGFVRIIQDHDGYEVMAECGNGNEAKRKIQESEPDIAVLDIAMPGLNGLEVVRWANSQRLDVIFLILTMYRDQEYFDEAMDLGVRGYLLKECAVRDLMACLAAVKSGRYYISPAISDYLMQSREKPATKQDHGLDCLTPTEKRVFKLIVENMTSREIAEALFVSYRTVQNHRFNICQKLGFKGHNKLLQYALEHKSQLED